MAQKNELKTKLKAGGKEEIVIPPPKIDVFVASDKLTAYLRVTVHSKEQRIKAEDVLKALEEKKVTYGILHSEIEAYCKAGKYFKEEKVALGKRPVKGADGDIEFHFRKFMTGLHTERDDGTMDYKKLDIIQNVEEGDVLCSIRYGEEGIDGIDVHGNPIEAKRGNDPDIPTGLKVSLTEDKLQLVADASGGISYRAGIIMIEDVFTVKGNVGLETGNINFNGSVIITGSVLESFEVEATGDITVNNIVEGAKVTAGGNILVKNGINGMRKAVITAGGNITSAFIESATVKCGGNLYADAILHGIIDVGHTVRLAGKKGIILGGEFRAGSCIKAKHIGNRNNIKQKLTIDPGWYEREQESPDEEHEDLDIKKERLELNKVDLEHRLNQLMAAKEREDKHAAAATDMSPAAVKQRKKDMLKWLQKKSEVTAALAEVESELKVIEDYWDRYDCKVICYNDAYHGTKIIMGKAVYRIDGVVNNQKFYLHEGEIITGPIQPNERD